MAKRLDVAFGLSAVGKVDNQDGDDTDFVTGVDLEGYRGALIIVGVHDDAAQTGSPSNYFDIPVRHSDSASSGYAAVGAEDLLTSAPAGHAVEEKGSFTADETKWYTVAYVGSKRYLEVGYDEHGTYADKDLSICVLRMRPEVASE